MKPGGKKPRKQRWKRAGNVTARTVSEELFIAAKDRGAIFNLNSSAAAVWHALDQPRTLDDLCRLFAAAFPEKDRRAIEVDLMALLCELRRQGLIVESPLPVLDAPYLAFRAKPRAKHT
jgi:hypothetical protein